MAIGIIFGFITAILNSVGYLCSANFLKRYNSPVRLLLFAQLVMMLPSIPVFLIFFPFTHLADPGFFVLSILAWIVVFVLGQGIAGSLVFLGTARFAAFITAGGLEPVFLSLLSRVSPEEKRGQIFGLTASFRSIGMMVASPLGGMIIYYLGVRSIYVMAAVGFLLTVPIFLYAVKLYGKEQKKSVLPFS